MIVLYSFRRCPYAMRARLALRLARQKVILREILLKDKPAEMLALSPKGTVPVLQLANKQVLDESAEIAWWALQENDPDHYLPTSTDDKALTHKLIEACDGDFKHWLDHYKYSDRYPEQTSDYYRQQGENYLQILEARLSKHVYLLGDKASLADIAIFPFVRQFAHVDKAWFDRSPYPHLQEWLQAYLESALFNGIMQKNPPWAAEQALIYL